MFVEVTDATFEEVVLASDVTVVAHFTAPSCKPCKAIEPHLFELAEIHRERIRLVRIDIDANMGTPSRYGILSIPTVIVFVGGEERATVIGAQAKRRYHDAVEPHL
jgi:thioredoxin 1